jgi:hypothetical protein
VLPKLAEDLRGLGGDIHCLETGRQSAGQVQPSGQASLDEPQPIGERDRVQLEPAQHGIPRAEDDPDRRGKEGASLKDRLDDVTVRQDLAVVAGASLVRGWRDDGAEVAKRNEARARGERIPVRSLELHHTEQQQTTHEHTSHGATADAGAASGALMTMMLSRVAT